MSALDPLEGDDDGTVFRDVIMLALLGFVTIVVLLLPHLNPPVKAEGAAEPPGNVVIEARWPDAIDADVDLWVLAPGDRPVGYSNRGGAVFNLLRDDLGHVRDQTPLNYEMAYSRGVPAGEYVINLHLYHVRSEHAEVPVDVTVSVKHDTGTSLIQLDTTSPTLRHVGEELTVLRFRLDEHGRVVPGSQHDLPRSLRNGGKTGSNRVRGG